MHQSNSGFRLHLAVCLSVGVISFLRTLPQSPSNLQIGDEAVQILKLRKENNGMVSLTFCHK